MLLLTALVTLCGRLVHRRGSQKHRSTLFYACLLFIAAGAMGAFASLDLFFFYAFHELALIPTFLLIGIWGSGNRSAAAWKITIYLATRQLHSAARVDPALSQRAGSRAQFRSSAPCKQPRHRRYPADAQSQIFLLLLIGFGILVSLFPFHTWAPEAYASAPAPAAMLHAGVLKKFGLYGLLRLGAPASAGRRAAMEHAPDRAVARQHHLRRPGHDRAEAARLDARLFERDAHGLHLSRDRQRQLLGTERRRLPDVRAWNFDRAPLCARRRNSRGAPAHWCSTISAVSAKSCRCAGFAFGLATFASIGLPGFANFAGEVMVFFGAFRNGANPEQLSHFSNRHRARALGRGHLGRLHAARLPRVFMGAMREALGLGCTDLRRSLASCRLDPARRRDSGSVSFRNTFVRSATPTFQTSTSPRTDDDRRACSRNRRAPSRACSS